MEKKIIAISLVVVLMLTVFVGCTKGEKYIDADGNEHLLVLDEEGNTMLNDNGYVIVYATEADGDIKKDKDGEPMTALIDFPETVIRGNTLETPDYKLTLPDTWELKENGDFVYKENNNISISILKMQELGVDDDLTSLYLEEVDKSKLFIDAIKTEYPDAEIITGEETIITMKNIKTRNIECRIYDDKNIMYYANTYYFVYGKNLYQINIVFEDMSYNETLDIKHIANQCLVMKGENA